MYGYKEGIELWGITIGDDGLVKADLCVFTLVSILVGSVLFFWLL